MGAYPSILDLKIWLFWAEDHSSKYNWVDIQIPEIQNPVDIQITDIKGINYVAFSPTIRHCYQNEINFGNNGDKMPCG